ncbi:hypothetical protein SAMN04490243_0389 [Robiginitalea myxolifaciens]|uniref:Uncharacterized protein n=1 Tax=Robiginitalea myxolifaciens TaxID=400055 RepID=A0A1I6FPQ5_9FLAO|nr:hypothetical protein [Robiginitalea myxolifaciens]SFR31921.1 hypothetical protein SAMN04490243_0389 [Robiginitalea myxolifaciens]
MAGKVNPFKQLERSLLEVPPHMKQRVMNDIAAAKLLLDVGELVSYNFPAAVEKTLKEKRRRKGGKKGGKQKP